MKALATNQVVLLVLAIIVLAVVAYLVYTQYMGGNRQIADTGCRSEAANICTGCKTCVIGLGGSFAGSVSLKHIQCGKLCSLSENCGIGLGVATYSAIPYPVYEDFCKRYGIS